MTIAFVFVFNGKQYRAEANQVLSQNIADYQISLHEPELQAVYGTHINFWRSIVDASHYGYTIPNAPDGLRFIHAVTFGLATECMKLQGKHIVPVAIRLR